MNVGAVGCLRQVRNAAGVAHAVMKYTKHTFLVGSLGTCIAYDYKNGRKHFSSYYNYTLISN